MTKIRPGTRDAILEAAFQTYNQSPTASLGDIAERAGVGRATLHRYFPSRDSLMSALAHTAMQELNDAVTDAVGEAASHTEGLWLALRAIVPLANRQWFLSHELLDTDPAIVEAYEQDLKDLRVEIDAAKSEGTFAKDVPTEWIAHAYENLIYTAWTLVRDGEATPDQAAELAWRTLTSGLENQVS